MRRRTVAARLFLATSSCALATAAMAGETITYRYDTLGRLVATSSSGTVNSGLSTEVRYDPAGNRSCYIVLGASSGSAGTCSPVPPPTPPPAAPPPPPPPAAPIANPDDARARTCGTVTIDVLANDTDSGGNYPLTLVSVSVTNGNIGTATIQGNFVLYHGNSAGSDSLTYTIRNSAGVTATGTVNVLVQDIGGCN